MKTLDRVETMEVAIVEATRQPQDPASVGVGDKRP